MSVRKGQKGSSWGYTGKVTINPRVEQVRIVGIEEASNWGFHRVFWEVEIDLFLADM